MGLFSDSTIISKSYDVARLKGDPSLEDDLWKNNKLKLNKSFLDGGIDLYGKTKFYLSKEIRKKYSSKYMESAGISQEEKINIYQFDKTTIANSINNILGTSDALVISIGDTISELSNNNDIEDLIFSNKSDVKGWFYEFDSSTNKFIIYDGTYSDNPEDFEYHFVPTTVETKTFNNYKEVSSTAKVIELKENYSEYYPNYYLGTEETNISISYNKIAVSYAEGIMHYEDAIRYLTKKCSDNYWWIDDVYYLAKVTTTSEPGIGEPILSISEYYDDLASHWIDLNPENFKYTITVSGETKFEDDTIDVVEETTDGECSGEDSTTVDESTELIEGYYNKEEVTETSSDWINVTAKSTATGNLEKRTVVTTEIKYTSGTRIDSNNNTISTCTKTTTTTTEIYGKCIDYIIECYFNIPPTYFLPKENSVILPDASSKYYDYYAINDYNPNSSYSIKYIEKYAGQDGKDMPLIDTTEYINIQPQSSAITGIIFNSTVRDRIASISENANPTMLVKGDPVSYSKSSMSSIYPPVIPVKYSSGGSIRTFMLVASSDTYKSSSSYRLTPIIPLKYGSTYFYQKSNVSHAKTFICNYLDNLVKPIYEANDDSDTYDLSSYGSTRILVNGDDISIKNSIKDDCNDCDSIACIQNIIDNERHSMFIFFIDKYVSPYGTELTADIVSSIVGSFTYATTDKKTLKMRKILSTLGVGKVGLDSIMNSVETNDIFSASIITGIQLFNSDNTLVADNANARAKALYCYADMLTGSGTVLGDEKSINIHSSALNVSYKFIVIKTHIDLFEDTNEQRLSIGPNGKKHGYLIRTEKKQIGSYTLNTGHGNSRIMPLYSQIVYVYKTHSDGSASRYEFREITMVCSSYDGIVQYSTSESTKKDVFNFTKISGVNLDKIVLAYPDMINSKLNFREYSVLYSDNLFLFVYARKETHVSWYRSSFFGFVLVVAAIVVSAITAQPEIAELGIAGTTVGTVGAFVSGILAGYGLQIMAPDMPMLMKMIFAIAIASPQTIGSSIEGTASASTSEMTLESVIDTAMSAVHEYIENNSIIEIGTDMLSIADKINSYYMSEKLYDLENKYGSEIAEITKKTKELMLNNQKFDIASDRTKIFASFIRNSVELESYEPVTLPSYLASPEFNADLLTYISSTEYQRDLVSVKSILNSGIV